MSVCFCSDWSFNGCRVLRLENEVLLVDVLPELGGKIWRFIDKELDRNWLWSHPRTKPFRVPGGTSYDDHFFGGFDELFPNASAVNHAGESYPDHGEYWTRPFEWSVPRDGDAVTLHLSAEGGVTPTRMERWLTLKSGSRTLNLRHRLTNLGHHGFDYLWAFHPAVSVAPGHQLIIPAGAATIAAPGMGRLSAETHAFTWPDAPGRDGEPVNLSIIPADPSIPGYEMVYLTELREGWWAVHDPAARAGFGLAFDRSFFTSIWVFLAHGGWRGLRVAVLEPCTGYPYDLGTAASSGRSSRLEPGQTVEIASAAVAYSGVERISGISPDGAII